MKKVNSRIEGDRRWAVHVYGVAAGILLGTLACTDGGSSAAPAAPTDTELSDLARSGPTSEKAESLPETGGPGAALWQSTQPVLPPRKPISLFMIQTDIDTNRLDLEGIKSGRQQPPLAPPLLLSVDVPGAPLKQVLLDLGRKLEAKVYMPEGAGEEIVQIRFKKLPLEEGIKRLVQPRSYLLVRGKVQVPEGLKDVGETRITEIRVLGQPRGGQEAETAPAVAVQEIKVDPIDQKIELEELVRLVREGETPRDRKRALAVYLDRADVSASPDVVMQAAKDPDPGVQKFALGRMTDLQKRPPVQPLVDMVVEGDNTGVRLAALDALLSTYGGQVTHVFEKIKGEDASPEMQVAAENALRRVERVRETVRKIEAARAAEAAKKAAGDQR